MNTKSLWAAHPMSRPRWLRSPRGRLQEVPEVRGQALELVVREVQPAGAALWGTRHTSAFLYRGCLPQVVC